MEPGTFGLKALDEVDSRLGETLSTTQRWLAVRAASQELLRSMPTLSADDSFARHTALIADTIALIAKLGHEARLTLDPDIDRTRLIDVLLCRGLELSESLARARSFGFGVAAASKRSEEQLEQLTRDSVLVEFLGARVDDSIAKALDSNAALRTALEAQAAATSSAVLLATADIAPLSRAEPPREASIRSSRSTAKSRPH